MSDWLGVLLVGGGFFLLVNAIAWSVWMLIERWMEAHHECWDFGSWCEHCMDDKQRMYAERKRALRARQCVDCDGGGEHTFNCQMNWV